MPRVSRAPALSVAGVSVLGRTACSAHVETDELEKQVATTLVQRGDVEVDSVHCLEELDAEPDATTACSVTVKGGRKLTANVTVTDTGGDLVQFMIDTE
ncbi:hypothetical protein FB384_000340 [Prauserella sediminis]|uniref:DUF4333 domain-containing protein n=1 Tax=Prauserella sediminis TaxID=577680 RepID=A0A839XN76_9PSEU|nr:DUF4333 domain-containing protein [Prauserella sediminis]MBB3661436.1 hypothetical protein [Prauserella sediminis]